jgi:hypothetical protein
MEATRRKVRDAWDGGAEEGGDLCSHARDTGLHLSVAEVVVRQSRAVIRDESECGVALAELAR